MDSGRAGACEPTIRNLFGMDSGRAGACEPTIRNLFVPSLHCPKPTIPAQIAIASEK